MSYRINKPSVCLFFVIVQLTLTIASLISIKCHQYNQIMNKSNQIKLNLTKRSNQIKVSRSVYICMRICFFIFLIITISIYRQIDPIGSQQVKVGHVHVEAGVCVVCVYC